MPYRLKSLNFWIMVVGDALLVFGAYWLAYQLRFEMAPDHIQMMKFSVWEELSNVIPWLVIKCTQWWSVKVKPFDIKIWMFLRNSLVEKQPLF